MSNKRKLFGNDRNGKQTKEPTPKKEVYTAIYKVNHSIELLEFLLTKCKTSRNNVKDLLSGHKVLVNGSMVSQYNFMLAKDDEVKISKHAVSNNNIKPTKKQLAQKPKLPFTILYNDDDFIAINKPAGLLSVESDNDNYCAFGIIFNYLQNIDKSKRPFILHRIDKETSGVLVFAKNIKLHSMLKMNWNELVKTREYYAIVEGTMEKQSDSIVTYLKENSTNLVYVTKDPTGQKAETNYEVVNSNDKFSLLKVNILTGRKNQIRVHMNYLKHPVVGDDKYGCNLNPINRLGLHASKLEFLHPVTKKLITITAPLPEQFKKLFN